MQKTLRVLAVLITSIAILIVFSFITLRLDHRSKWNNSQEDPSCNESHEGNSAQGLQGRSQD